MRKSTISNLNGIFFELYDFTTPKMMKAHISTEYKKSQVQRRY